VDVAIKTIIVSRDECVSDFRIGYFGDQRLLKTGALLFKKMMKKMTMSISKLSDNRAMQVAFGRFLSNGKTTSDEIELTLANKTNENCFNKKHVLCVQDTIEVNYSKQPIKKSKFGANRNKKEEQDVKGFLAHPGLILDAENSDILGLSSVKVWTRSNDEIKARKQRPIEEKESYKWIETAEAAKKNIPNAELVTIIGDRESDIYELFDRVPDDITHIIARAMHDRELSTGLRIDEHMKNIPSLGTYEIELPAITGVRQARIATIEIKYSKIKITAPPKLSSTVNNTELSITCVEAREIGDVPNNESGIFWRLFTTHSVNNLLEAKQIIIWYSWRWNIEQVFRTLKKKGIKIEDSQVITPESLLKLFVIAIAAAVTILCLVKARDGSTERPASDVFSDDELVVLFAVLLKVNGKTKKQQNPYKPNSLSWASWIIARLGGWNGYTCERPPGPITMYSGLEVFNHYVQGWLLAQKDVCMR